MAMLLQVYFIDWFLSGCAKAFVLLIIIFVATGNQEGMQTVHWRKVNYHTVQLLFNMGREA